MRTLDLFCEESCDSQTRQTRRQLPLTELPLEVKSRIYLPLPSSHSTPVSDSSMQVCEQVHLQRLWANHNLLSSLPPNLPRLRHLQELLLHQNKFTEFPLVVCSLSCLQMLWLSFNQIPCIPDDISNLSSLRRLHLDHNQLTELPDALCDLPHLQVLYLNHNSLTRVSEFIGKLTSLRHLLLQHNLIGTLPRGMTELSAVERLDLRHNCLRHLSMDFTFFQSEMNNNGKRVLTEGNPFDKSLVRMRSADQTSPVLRPRTMSFPISGQTRRKSDSTHSPSPSSPTTARRHKRHHLFVHSFSEEQS